jgi:hypothetical protein
MSSISHPAPISSPAPVARPWARKLERADDKPTPLAFFRRRRTQRRSLPEHVFCDAQYSRQHIV